MNEQRANVIWRPPDTITIMRRMSVCCRRTQRRWIATYYHNDTARPCSATGASAAQTDRQILSQGCAACLCATG